MTVCYHLHVDHRLAAPLGLSLLLLKAHLVLEWNRGKMCAVCVVEWWGVLGIVLLLFVNFVEMHETRFNWNYD